MTNDTIYYGAYSDTDAPDDAPRLVLESQRALSADELRAYYALAQAYITRVCGARAAATFMSRATRHKLDYNDAR